MYAKRHSYSVGVITLCVLLIISATAGLRCAAQVLAIMSGFIGIPRLAPSWSSGRLWMLRVGYYKLTRAKEIAQDWVWIVDHTLQSGEMKCLGVLGVRLSALDEGRDKPLSHEDVEPITLCPVRQSSGDIVYQQLDNCIKKTGVPRQIVGDHGSDLKAGIELFLAEHPETAYIYDVKHCTASILEHTFESDLMWTEFTKWASETRRALHQTSLSYLEPPNQRSKSRYMNMDILVDWGTKVLQFFDNLEQRVSSVSERVAIRKKLDWIEQFRPDITEWQVILELVSKTEDFVRKRGLFRGCDTLVRSILGLPPGVTARTLKIRWQLIEYVLDESLKVRPGERLLGSSEVIESVFGKFKYLQGEHARGALTGFVLSIAAMVSTTTEEVVHQALESVSANQVRAWVKQNFGKSPHIKRKEAFASLIVPEQKQDRLPVPA